MDQATSRFRHILPWTEYLAVIDQRLQSRAPSLQLKPKRSPVTVACNDCRRKRIKCDGQRPSCSACLRSSLSCIFRLPEGISFRDAQSHKLDQVTKAHADLRTVLEVLRGTEEEEDAIAILRLLRDSDSLDDAVQMVADASVLTRVAETESRPSDETRYSLGGHSLVTSSESTPSAPDRLIVLDEAEREGG